MCCGVAVGSCAAETSWTFTDVIVGTDRIATIQTRLAGKLATSYPIRVVPLPLPLSVLEEVMMWQPRLDRDAGHAWLRGVLRETAAALPAIGTRTAQCGATQAAAPPGLDKRERL